jgi:hypothetical protein
MNDPLKTTTSHRGRLITKATKWWWEYSNISYDELRCIHDQRLSEKCDTCKEEAK